jgi:hypothetical protein
MLEVNLISHTACRFPRASTTVNLTNSKLNSIPTLGTAIRSSTDRFNYVLTWITEIWSGSGKVNSTTFLIQMQHWDLPVEIQRHWGGKSGGHGLLPRWLEAVKGCSSEWHSGRYCNICQCELRESTGSWILEIILRMRLNRSPFDIHVFGID